MAKKEKDEGADTATATEEAPKQRERKLQMPLKCVLTAEELRLEGENMARHYAELSDTEKEFEDVKAQYKSRITSLESQISVCAGKIRDKAEHRHVDCLEVFDFASGKVCVWRNDTGELVTSRTMREDERQGMLSDGKGVA